MQISRGPVIVSAFAALFMVALNLVLSIETARQLFGRADWVDHTHEVLIRTEDMVSLLRDNESGLRGYLLTKREKYIEDFPGLSKSAESKADRLIELVKDNPTQVELAKDLKLAVLDKVEFMLQSHDKIQRGESPDLSVDTGFDLMSRVETLADTFQAEEDRLLQTRQDSLEQAYRTTIISGLGSGIAVLLSIGLHFALASQLQKKLVKQAETIRAHSELLHITFRSIGDGVITTDQNGLVTDLNSIAETLTGWTIDKAKGVELSKVFHIVNETTRVPVENPALRALSSGQIVGLANHTALIRPDGSESPIDDSAAPIRAENGTITGSVLVFRDVSNRRAFEKQLQESERTFRALFDSAPIGIVNSSLDGKFVRVNRRFCEIVRMSQEELVGHTFGEITHSDTSESRLSLGDSVFDLTTDTYNVNKRYVNLRGEVIWVNVAARLIRDFEGIPASIIAAVTDISEQRAAEEMRIRMSAIVNTSNDAIITKDLNGIVRSWNGAAAKLFGYEDTEMVGGPIFKIVPEDKHSEELDLLRRSGLREVIEPKRTERLRRDGSRVEVLLKVAPLVDSDGTLLGISTIAKDLTAESRAEMELKESEKRFRMLADNISQFAWMADPTGSVYWYNKRWYDFTGTTLEEMQGWGWQSVHHPDHVDRVMQSIQNSWDTGNPWEETFPLRGKDGNYRWFLSRALPIRDSSGKISHWFGSNTDITEIIENEDKLKNARRAAELATKARGEFLANMSHEIRTPMTAILGHTELLADHINNPDDLQLVDTIRRNGKFLLQIINDILDLSKIDAGKFEIDRCKIAPAEVLHEIRSLLDVRAAEKRLNFHVNLDGSIPNKIQTDPVRLRQILVNLVGNAIKFTDKGDVELRCRYDQNRNQMIFRVLDTGIGIDTRILPKLFQPFVQADTSSTRAFEGTGLGLVISKRLAEMLGGTINVESRLGEGSEFSLEIDCGAINPEEPWVDEIQPIVTDSKPQRYIKVEGLVMVVDDRRDIRFLAQSFLEKAGARVVLATNGQEAIDKLMSPQFAEQNSVDAVLMDMQMPIMDGYTAAKKLRELGFTKPIIALTANAMKDDRDKCLACGCDDYATKPLDGSTLVHIVASHIQKNPTVAPTPLNG